MDFLGIGFSELMFILIIAMMVFGPKRLPEMASKAGKLVRDLRGMSQGLMAEWQRELNVSVRLDELKEIRQELEDTKEALNMAKKDIQAEASSATKVASDAAKSTEEAVKSMTKPLETKPKETATTDSLPEPEPEVVAHENGNGVAESTAQTKSEPSTAEPSKETSEPEPVIDARLVADPQVQDTSSSSLETSEDNDALPEAASAETKEAVNE